MSTKILIPTTLAIILVAGPGLAQHGGMHEHNPARGGSDSHMDMGGMHGDQMMNHMNMVMDQMGEMMQEMHGNQAEMAGHMDNMAGLDHRDMHVDMMQTMSSDMGQMMTAMQSMFEHMQGYMNDEAIQGDATTMGHMNEMMKHLDGMMQAGHGMTSEMVDMNRPEGAPEHDGHQN